MKIQVISDLHFEFGLHNSNYDKMIDTNSDIIVLAGDVHVGDELFKSLTGIQVESNKPIIYVPGNHEYYGRRKDRFDRALKEFNELNQDIHILLEDKVMIDDITFIGTTGWWDGSGGEINALVKRSLNDFTRIFDIMNEGNDEGKKWGETSRDFITDTLEELNGKICVVTHHYPHYKSIDPEYSSSPINVCFGNRWEWIIDKFQPECWIHGHTHSSFDYMVKDTRIVCNPQGYITYLGQNYYDVENKNFNPSKVIEL